MTERTKLTANASVSGRREEVISVRVRPQERAVLEMVAAAGGESLSAFVRGAVLDVAQALTGLESENVMGAAGQTHCGQWTTDVPTGIWATRLVCSNPVNHRGRHYSRWSGYEWADGESPRRRKEGSNPKRPLRLGGGSGDDDA